MSEDRSAHQLAEMVRERIGLTSEPFAISDYPGDFGWSAIVVCRSKVLAEIEPDLQTIVNELRGHFHLG